LVFNRMEGLGYIRLRLSFIFRKDRTQMIKIIKPGTKQEKHCDYCGCLFSFEEEDVRAKTTVHTGGFPGIAKGGTYINCPQCKKEISLEAVR